MECAGPWEAMVYGVGIDRHTFLRRISTPVVFGQRDGDWISWEALTTPR